ncbi:hypothetical protein Tco_0232346 [Tanacetum coccineum]
MQHLSPNNNYVPQPSFNMNYMQQLMQNLDEITDPTTTINMALILIAKAFKLNYYTPTNNNQRISSNPHNRQITQPGQIARNQNGFNAVQNAGNQNVNQNGNGNVVAAQAEGNGECEEIEEVNANCILMANLQQASTLGTQDPVYDSDGSAKYAELLEPTTGPYLVQQNDKNVILEESNMDPSRGTVEQHPGIVEETRAFFKSLYNNLVIEVGKVNTVNRKIKEANDELTTELERYKGNEKYFEFNQAKFDELENGYKKFVYQEKCLTKKINALHLSSAKTITTLNEEIANLNNHLSKEKSIVSYLQQEREKLKSDFKTREYELLDKLIQSEKKVKELDNILVKTCQSIQMMHMFLPKPDLFSHTEHKMALGYQNPFYLKQAQLKQQSLYNGNDHVTAILDYGDLQWGNILIAWVYFDKGLGYNLFSVGHFCDSDLEVAFRRNYSLPKISKELIC